MAGVGGAADRGTSGPSATGQRSFTADSDRSPGRQAAENGRYEDPPPSTGGDAFPRSAFVPCRSRHFVHGPQDDVHDARTLARQDRKQDGFRNVLGSRKAREVRAAGGPAIAHRKVGFDASGANERYFDVLLEKLAVERLRKGNLGELGHAVDALGGITLKPRDAREHDRS